VNISKTFLEQLPIREVSYKEQSLYINVVNEVMHVIKSENYDQSTQKQAKVNALKQEIDQLVYKLYDLTPEEIKIVEGKMQK